MEIINNELVQFTGTMKYYKFNNFCKMVLTDGTQYLAQKAGCFWLFDIVASVQHKKKISENRDFIVWKIRINDKDNSCFVEAFRDSPFTKDNLLYRQKISHTDFKERTGFSEFEFYQEGRIILLKSEH